MSADALHIQNNTMRIVADTNDTTVLQQIIEFLEDLEDVRLYNEAMADDEPGIPADEAFEILETPRKPMCEKLDIEQLKKEQNFKPIDKAELFRKIDELNIEEPLEDLLAMIYTLLG